MAAHNPPYYFRCLFVLFFVSVFSTSAGVLTTNLGGWNVTLSSKTNFYWRGENISVFATVSNMTQKVGYLEVTGSYLDCCDFEIIDAKTGKKPSFWPSDSDDIKEGRLAILPGKTNTFECNLASIYVFTNAATYAVSFRGNLGPVGQSANPSNFPTAPGFDLSPLFITIGDPSKQSNQSTPNNSFANPEK